MSSGGKYKSVAHQNWNSADNDKEANKSKEKLKPIPKLTPDLLAKLKLDYEYGTLPPNYWTHYRDVHMLIDFIESNNNVNKILNDLSDAIGVTHEICSGSTIGATKIVDN